MFFNTLVKMAASKPNLTCLAQFTFKFVNKALLVPYRRLSFYINFINLLFKLKYFHVKIARNDNYQCAWKCALTNTDFYNFISPFFLHLISTEEIYQTTDKVLASRSRRTNIQAYFRAKCRAQYRNWCNATS